MTEVTYSVIAFTSGSAIHQFLMSRNILLLSLYQCQAHLRLAPFRLHMFQLLHASLHIGSDPDESSRPWPLYLPLWSVTI